MGTSKTEIFSSEQNEIAEVAKAISHPARIAILQYLLSKNSCICGDIVDEIGLAQATVSQHLKELKKAGIIQGNIEGRNVCYCIDLSKWEASKSLITSFFKELNKTNCC